MVHATQQPEAAEHCDCFGPSENRTEAVVETRAEAQWRCYGFDRRPIAGLNGRGRQFTFWDYQAGAWRRDHGIRIDHALVSPQAADLLEAFTIHRDVRAREKASDHVPVVVTLSD